MAEEIRVAALLSRLNDYYDRNDLISYDRFCHECHIDRENGIRFLYRQTFAEYHLEVDESLRIEKYALSLLLKDYGDNSEPAEIERILAETDFALIFHKNNDVDPDGIIRDKGEDYNDYGDE